MLATKNLKEKDFSITKDDLILHAYWINYVASVSHVRLKYLIAQFLNYVIHLKTIIKEFE